MKDETKTIKVFKNTRGKLKILAAHLGINMQEAAEVAIVEKMERERIPHDGNDGAIKK